MSKKAMSRVSSLVRFGGVPVGVPAKGQAVTDAVAIASGLRQDGGGSCKGLGWTPGANENMFDQTLRQAG